MSSGDEDVSRSGKVIESLNRSIQSLRNQQEMIKNAFGAGRINVIAYMAAMMNLQDTIVKTRAHRLALNSAMQASKRAEAGFSAARAGLASAVTTVTVSPLVGMIQSAADFETAMAKVRAATGASGKDFQDLTVKARELGEKTPFSAQQTADAMAYLGNTGWKTNQILSGMPGIANMAVISGKSLANTADSMTENLTAYGMGAEQATHMADVFAKTATTTKTNMETLGTTMKYAAPAAQAFGVSLEETSALAGIMSSKGIEANQAGEALRAGFMRLAGGPAQPAKAMEELGVSMEEMSAGQQEASKAMQSLGIEMSDTNGPKNMSLLLQELQDKTAGLSEAEKSAAFSSVFGADAAAGWMAALDSGPETLDRLVNSLQNCDGASSQMAQSMQGDTNAAVERLKSAMDSMALTMGSSFLPVVAEAAGQMADWAGKVAEVARQYPEVTEGVAAASSAIAGGIGYYKATKVVSEGYNLVKAKSLEIFQRETALIGKAMSSTKRLSVAARAAAIAQWAWNAAMTANPAGVIIMVIAGIIAAGYLLYKNWGTITAFLGNAWNGAVQAVSDAWNGLCAYFSNGWNSLTSGISNAWGSFQNFFANLPSMIGYAIGYVVGFLSTLPSQIGGFITAAVFWLDQLPANCMTAGLAFILAAETWLVSVYNMMSIWISTTINNVCTWLYNLPQTCMIVGAQFISTAASWAQGAYNAIVYWIQQIPAAISNFVSGAWSNFTASISIGVQDGKKQKLARGGIFQQGAFLTTFAEESPEAAIPLDGSPRAISLWQQAGEMLGMSPVSIQGGGGISATFAPQIHIAGRADSDAAHQIQQVLQESLADFERKLNALQNQKARVSYV